MSRPNGQALQPTTSPLGPLATENDQPTPRKTSDPPFMSASPVGGALATASGKHYETVIARFLSRKTGQDLAEVLETKKTPHQAARGAHQGVFVQQELPYTFRGRKGQICVDLFAAFTESNGRHWRAAVSCKRQASAGSAGEKVERDLRRLGLAAARAEALAIMALSPTPEAEGVGCGMSQKVLAELLLESREAVESLAVMTTRQIDVWTAGGVLEVLAASPAFIQATGAIEIVPRDLDGLEAAVTALRTPQAKRSRGSRLPKNS